MPARYDREIERIVVACRAHGKSSKETVAWLTAIKRLPKGKRWHSRTIVRILARHRFELAPAIHGPTRAARRRQ